MRRVLIFPPIIAAWLMSAQFGRMVVGYAIGWYMLRIASGTTDIYYVTPRNSAVLLSFLPAATIGAALGTTFAILDFALHRHTRRTKETVFLLIRNLIRSGVVAVILILLCQGYLFYVTFNFAHRRYHAYPPDMQALNLIYELQVFIVFAGLLWSMAKTLKR